MSDTFYLIVGIIISLFGILCFWGVIKHSILCSYRIIAKIIRMEKDKQSYWRGTFNYYPVFSYTVNGKEYITKDKLSSTRNKNKYKVGQEVAIKCNPKIPEEIKISAKALPYIISITLIAIGNVLIVCYFL